MAQAVDRPPPQHTPFGSKSTHTHPEPNAATQSASLEHTTVQDPFPQKHSDVP